ncbi:MAG: hypothetical protein BAJALOKI3v1_50060 [Promethearchaeota archaeon]|nr:MAG: hypothetical protein BAJALOKI3v1_50060 [Candidatus Lokiarchaeota archaeon]
MYTYDEALKKSTEYFNGDELAASVWLGKYALQDNDGNLLENSPDQMHRRLAKEFARIEKNKFKQPLNEDDIYKLFDKFKYIIPQGSAMYGIGNDFQFISLSNCYLLEAPLDSYNSIILTDQQLVNISKRRGGCGIDISNLRPNGTPTKNAARTSTGIIPFMDRYSNSTREVGQANRRGALMLTLSVHHPEIEDFATIKNNDTKVTGANISVRLSKEFIDAVRNDEEYEQRWPIDAKNPVVSRMVSAQKVWQTIVHSAWTRAEPGLLMWDNVTKNTPADYYPEYQSKGVNPCQPAWAEVLTPDGIKTIGDLEIGDSILSKEGWTTVINKWSSGIQDVYKFYTTHGTFAGTKQHKIFSNGKKIAVEDALGIDSPYLSNSKILKTEFISSEEVFDITVDNKSNSYWSGGLDVSNCSEINLSELDSCRLLVLNVLSFVNDPFTPNSTFDFDKFRQYAKIAQRLMDDMVDLESEKISRIIEKIESDPEPHEMKQYELNMWTKIKRLNDEGRRTGTGVTAIGDALAALNIQYGSDKSIDMVEQIYRTLKLGCYESSVEMAEEIGSFKCFDHNLEKDCPFILRIKEEEPDLYDRMAKSGRRNIALTTTAPTGSVSILTQTSSGIEPVFRLSYTRRKKIHDDVNSRVDFIDDVGDKWQEFTVYHPSVLKWMDVTGETDETKSPWFGSCSPDINWINRVKMQAAAQRHVCHGISSTINLPNDATEETVNKIYLEAFASGCKGITVYRDGCRSGVLVENPKKTTIIETAAPKRPKKLPCDVYHCTNKGDRYYVVVGKFDGLPYEVFTGKNDDGEGDTVIPKAIKVGELVKKSRGHYVLTNDERDYSCKLTNGHSDDAVDALTRMISTSLRHGVPISFIVEQLEKTKGDLQSFSKVLARTLKRYIPDGTISTEDCPECGEQLVRKEGCLSCNSCGWSKCC